MPSSRRRNAPIGVSRSAVRVARSRIVSAAAGEALGFGQAERVGHRGPSFGGSSARGPSAPENQETTFVSRDERPCLPRCHPHSAVCRTLTDGRPCDRLDRRCPVSLALCAGAYLSSAAGAASRSVRWLPGPFAAAAIPASHQPPGLWIGARRVLVPIKARIRDVARSLGAPVATRQARRRRRSRRPGAGRRAATRGRRGSGGRRRARRGGPGPTARAPGPATRSRPGPAPCRHRTPTVVAGRRRSSAGSRSRVRRRPRPRRRRSDAATGLVTAGARRPGARIRPPLARRPPALPPAGRGWRRSGAGEPATSVGRGVAASASGRGWGAVGRRSGVGASAPAWRRRRCGRRGRASVSSASAGACGVGVDVGIVTRTTADRSAPSTAR